MDDQRRFETAARRYVNDTLANNPHIHLRQLDHELTMLATRNRYRIPDGYIQNLVNINRDRLQVAYFELPPNRRRPPEPQVIHPHVFEVNDEMFQRRQLEEIARQERQRQFDELGK